MFNKNSIFMAMFAAVAMLSLSLPLQAITIANTTPAPMVIIGQYSGGVKEDITSFIKGGDAETIKLTRVPETIIVRDAEFKWTNVPELITSVYSLDELNNATLMITGVEGSTYRKNAPFNIDASLVWEQIEGQQQPQAEVKRQAQAARQPAQVTPAQVAQAVAQGGARPATEAPLKIRKQILAHLKQMGVDPREYADLEQSIIAEERAQEAPKKLLSTQQEAALANFAQMFIQKSEEIKAALQKRFADAKSIKPLGNGDWMIVLPDNLIKIVDATGMEVLKTISKGKTFVGDYTPVKKSASEAESADEAAESLV